MHDTYKIDKQKLERVPDRLKKEYTETDGHASFFLNTPKQRLGSGGKIRVSQVPYQKQIILFRH